MTGQRAAPRPSKSRVRRGSAAGCSSPGPGLCAYLSGDPRTCGAGRCRASAAIVRDAAEHASDVLSARGLPPLPHTTPHLRRTYISIALLANRFDVLWVMGQVGHADSKMTMDVYAQLQQRVKREHGMAFDRLVDQAREQLYGTAPPASADPEWGV